MWDGFMGSVVGAVLAVVGTWWVSKRMFEKQRAAERTEVQAQDRRRKRDREAAAATALAATVRSGLDFARALQRAEPTGVNSNLDLSWWGRWEDAVRELEIAQIVHAASLPSGEAERFESFLEGVRQSLVVDEFDEPHMAPFLDHGPGIRVAIRAGEVLLGELAQVARQVHVEERDI